jgi:predicted RNase H-like HicB family nuclease
MQTPAITRSLVGLGWSRSLTAMLTAYIREAMRLAHYELMENGRFFATIPGLKGLWAEDATLEACREELQSTLEDWIMIKVRFGDKDFLVLNGSD